MFGTWSDRSSIRIYIIRILLWCKSDLCFGLEMILWVMPSELLSWKVRRKFKYCTQPFFIFSPHRDKNRPRCSLFRCRSNFFNTCRKSAPLTYKQNAEYLHESIWLTFLYQSVCEDWCRLLPFHCSQDPVYQTQFSSSELLPWICPSTMLLWRQMCDAPLPP